MGVVQGNLPDLQPWPRSVALTIGNFDGVHRGHQHLIKFLLKTAEDLGVEAVVLCFDPHPDIVFQTPQFELLMTLQDKVHCLESLGVQWVVLQDFNRKVADVPAQDFLRQYLQAFFNLKGLILGYDFRFGSRGQGDFKMAQGYFNSSGVQVLQAPVFKLGEEILSSTLIRDQLRAGEVNSAEKSLGRPYQVIGQVEAGEQLGRTLGFPTANLTSIQTLIPGDGVYFCRAYFAKEMYSAVVNIGVRPTVSGERRTVEAHLLNFSGDLYGQTLKIQFLQKIRDEKKFSDLSQLKEQIQRDINQVSQWETND
jgi:riboflavin kinase/FMN adenylyltransferase